MHIVALVEGVERVLCSMRFYKETGLFCATPGFSDPIVDPETDPDVFLKGPKLTTYHLTTPSGSLYEYVLDNEHDLLPFASAEDQRLSREIRLQEEKRDVAEVTRWQLSKNPKLQPTIAGNNNRQRKMMISIEIVGVYNPETTDPVLVEYELELPGRSGHSQWKLQPGNYIRKRGKTEMSIPQRSAYPGYLSAAALGYHQHFNLTLGSSEAEADKDGDVGSIVSPPIFHLSVFSRDSWRRKRSLGHGVIILRETSGFYDFDVPIRKPMLSIRDRMEELFLGIDESDEAFVGDRVRECQVNSDESPLTTMITSRLGQKSESTGTTVRIRFNIVDVQPKSCTRVDTTGLTQRPTATPFVKTRVVKRSVQEILQSVKLEKRLASITDPRIQAALRSLPSTGTKSIKHDLV
ncbi:hypothetical protein DVH05_008932 [Phytophthora capsici]|nr:hypothetical protein DVH05_008932 [Phytophthora capsici]